MSVRPAFALEKSVVLKGEAATDDIIWMLGSLLHAWEERQKVDLDVHVRITVTNRDVGKRMTYYIDRDGQYIYAGNDGEGYAMPSGLTGILKSLGVYR